MQRKLEEWCVDKYANKEKSPFKMLIQGKHALCIKLGSRKNNYRKNKSKQLGPSVIHHYLVEIGISKL